MNTPKVTKLSDLDLLQFGHSIDLVGAIYLDEVNDVLYLTPLPGKDQDLIRADEEILDLGLSGWEKLLNQLDTLETLYSDGISKAIIRKSQRLVDAHIMWRCFRRDGFKCSYCGDEKSPMTVDHLIPWEQGGPTIEQNLVTSCKKCNKVRGNTPYEQWLGSEYYLSRNINEEQKMRNLNKVLTLDKIHKVNHVRSR